ncbi:leukocyte elastase inhibitor-like protein, partial [Leptotrombidium deliense]
FCLDLFRVLCKDSTKNEFFSPFSILTALNMTLMGAKNKTEKEMFEGLRYSLGFSNSSEVHTYFKKLLNDCQQSESCTLDVANRVLIHKANNFQVNPEYAKRLLDVYKAEVTEANFNTEKDAVLKTCNEWVNKITKGKIPSILESLEPDARAVLLNAIYFKGTWEKQFEENCTKDEPFYNFGDKNKANNVPIMQKGKTKCCLYS